MPIDQTPPVTIPYCEYVPAGTLCNEKIHVDPNGATFYRVSARRLTHHKKPAKRAEAVFGRVVDTATPSTSQWCATSPNMIYVNNSCFTPTFDRSPPDNAWVSTQTHDSFPEGSLDDKAAFCRRALEIVFIVTGAHPIRMTAKEGTLTCDIGKPFKWEPAK